MLDLQREEEKKSPLIIRGEISLINELNFVFRHYTLWSGINEKRKLRFERKFFKGLKDFQWKIEKKSSVTLKLHKREKFFRSKFA